MYAMARSRRRSRARRNPLGLSNVQLAGAGVAAAAAIGGIAYLAMRKSGSSSCWSPVPQPFTMVPGRYRLEIAIPPGSQASAPAQFQKIVADLPAAHQQLPGLTILSMWLGSSSYPAGQPLPTDWPTTTDPPTVLRVQLSCAYSMAGSPMAGKALPEGMRLWSCSTGPIPAQQPLPADLASVLAQLAAGSQAVGGALQMAPGGRYQPGPGPAALPVSLIVYGGGPHGQPAHLKGGGGGSGKTTYPLPGGPAGQPAGL